MPSLNFSPSLFFAHFNYSHFLWKSILGLCYSNPLFKNYFNKFLVNSGSRLWLRYFVWPYSYLKSIEFLLPLNLLLSCHSTIVPWLQLSFDSALCNAWCHIWEAQMTRCHFTSINCPGSLLCESRKQRMPDQTLTPQRQRGVMRPPCHRGTDSEQSHAHARRMRSSPSCIWTPCSKYQCAVRGLMNAQKGKVFSSSEIHDLRNSLEWLLPASSC